MYEGYQIGSTQKVYQNSLSETYLVGPGNAGLVLFTKSYYYNDERMQYYRDHPWARR